MIQNTFIDFIRQNLVKTLPVASVIQSRTHSARIPSEPTNSQGDSRPRLARARVGRHRDGLFCNVEGKTILRLKL